MGAQKFNFSIKLPPKSESLALFLFLAENF